MEYPWQQLKKGEIDCQQALNLLIDERGTVNLELLDPEVSGRFFRLFSHAQQLPPVVPLLLWRNCYYLGSPIIIEADIIQKLSDRTFTDIKILSITEKSYSGWYHTQNLDLNKISGDSLINPLTKELESENIAELTELYLSKASDQIQRVKTLFSGALRNRASDIHLEPMPEGLRVRYRIDGVLRHITTFPLEISRRVVVATKVMSDLDIGESRRPQDGRIGQKYALGESSDVGLDMRVSTLPCIGGEKVVIRLLPQRNPFSNMGGLGFSDSALEIYKRWLSQPQGMIILTGPTGSGKTSTLYTSLQSVAKESVNVVTVEDPVEYVLSGITQTQVNEAAGMTFAAGLRAILRQDPDVIMVGEIRDNETAETAVRAALTGHLVFTTLHTNDAVGTIPRLKDVGPDPGLISDALLGIVAQRLVRRVCPHCAEPYTPTSDDLRKLGLKATPETTQYWLKGKGCIKCFNSGYLGREAIVELLDVDDRVRELIYQGTMTELNRYLKTIDFTSFSMAAAQKVTTGVTTIEEVFRVLPHSALCH
ncbi:GspE/PulE family protein [Anabaena sp. UHCC 0204]|uniref:GspE/PulE family protein n=1 Tax=Anabaena sp. UHCC 0204 TaxID=2590009 RepID=UPI001445D5E8|nr:GspE/PulE family protein [Anabaena sp. UHCC 0204]MTJ07994.1 type II/IV secretion system protein [Anabaena sp. UHCC 0204]